MNNLPPVAERMSQITDDQRTVACYLFLSPYHPETWPIDLIDRLVELRKRDERKFLIEVRNLTYGP